MKKNTKKIDFSLIGKEFESLCKKHKLDSAIMVVEHGKEKIDNTANKTDLLISTHSKSKVKEKALHDATMKLFSVIGLNVNALSIAHSFMKEEEKRQDLTIRISKLSKKDKKRLAEIQVEKHALVEKKEYEKAAHLRQEELDLLGYKPEPISSVDECVLTHQLLPEDINIITQKLIDSMKGWKLSK